MFIYNSKKRMLKKLTKLGVFFVVIFIVQQCACIAGCFDQNDPYNKEFKLWNSTLGIGIKVNFASVPVLNPSYNTNHNLEIVNQFLDSDTFV